MTAEAIGRTWSSHLASYLAVVGAAVGLGSVWRFPYLAGTHGGGAFVAVFVLACLAIATPLLVAEFILGRATQRNPPEAAGEFARGHRGGRLWDATGILGTAAAFLINSYYTVIAGWVLRYLWLCSSGALAGMARPDLEAAFRSFMADPVGMGGWQVAFLTLAAVISAGGLRHGIEIANRIRAPAFLLLLLILAVYATVVGDVGRGLRFAFWPDWSHLSAAGVLAAIGQAFFATGVGMAMMIAYGAYLPRRVSLLHAAMAISCSIVTVSLLATLIIFPLVFRYGVNPAQGPELVFQVLPALFSEMPAGRIIGTLFFLLLVFAALTPTIASLEPVVSWLEGRLGLQRGRAVAISAVATWFVGIGSIFSFSRWSGWYPLAWIPRFRGMTFYTVTDFVTSNIMLPVGALLTSVLVGWVVVGPVRGREVDREPGRLQQLTWVLLKYLCPLAILTVCVAALAGQ